MLELGFLRGVAVVLLIFGCLVGLLVGTLRGIAAYLHRHDTKLWERYEELYVFDDDEKEDEGDLAGRHPNVSNDVQTYNSSSGRASRYMSANPSTPITKINAHASPRRAAVVASSSGSPSKMGCMSSVTSPATPLRSALSRSPPPSSRFSSAQAFFFGTRPASPVGSPASSPKSVRWADQVHISVISTVEMSVQNRRDEPAGSVLAQAEQDIATRTVGNRNNTIPDDAFNLLSAPVYHVEPPAYTAVSIQTPASDADHVISRLSSDLMMRLEGDTS